MIKAFRHIYRMVLFVFEKFCEIDFLRMETVFCNVTFENRLSDIPEKNHVRTFIFLPCWTSYFMGGHGVFINPFFREYLKGGKNGGRVSKAVLYGFNDFPDRTWTFLKPEYGTLMIPVTRMKNLSSVDLRVLRPFSGDNFSVNSVSHAAVILNTGDSVKCKYYIRMDAGLLFRYFLYLVDLSVKNNKK
jgi:hypothetical protein